MKIGVFKVLLLYCVVNSYMMIPAFADIKTEYQVKATYLCAFLKYITFDGNINEYKIGVLGENPFRGKLKAFHGKEYNGKRISIHFFGKDADHAARANCQILFVAKSEQLNQKDILKRIDKPNTVTVGDNKWFINSGGMLNLVIVGKKVGWEVNQPAIRNKTIKVSSKILLLAIKGGTR